VSTTWSLTIGEFITQAYRRLGVLGAGLPPSAAMFNDGLVAANALLKGWQAKGANLYRLTQVAMQVGALQGQPGNPFSLEPLVMSILDARWVVQPSPNLYERPLGIYTYLQYMSLPNKQAPSSSGPSVIMFDKQNLASNFYFFPLPSVSGTCNITAARTVDDVVNVNDMVDFPTEWSEDFIYTLADRLMDNHGVAAADPATADRISKRAIAFDQVLLDFDRPTSLFMLPYGKKGRGRAWRG
jgi:hypothetical protein